MSLRQGMKVKYSGDSDDHIKYGNIYTFARYNTINDGLGYIKVGEFDEFPIRIYELSKIDNDINCKSNCKGCKGKCSFYERGV